MGDKFRDNPETTGIDEKRYADQLDWHAVTNNTLNELSKALITKGQFIKEISELFLNHALSLSGSKQGYVSEVAPDSGVNTWHAFTPMLESWGMQDTEKAISFPKGKDGLYPALWGHALNTKKAFYTNSPQKHKSSLGTPPDHTPIQNFLCAPAVVNDEIIGQIALANSPEPYNHRHLEAVERIASLYALAVRHHRMQTELHTYQERLEEMVSERTSELTAMNERYSALVNAMPDSVIRFDTHGNILDVKQSEDDIPDKSSPSPGATISDLPMDYSIQNDFLFLVRRAVENDAIQIYEYQRDAEEGADKQYYEARFVKSGSSEAVCWIRNITERKNQEEILKSIRYSIDHSGECVGWLDQRGRIIYANESACRTLGYSKSELLQMTASQIDVEIAEGSWQDFWEKLKYEEKTIQRESNYKRKDGQIIPVEITANFEVFEGKESIFIFFRDISERKHTQDRLRKERDFNKTLIDTSPTFFVAIDTNGNVVMMNKAMLNATGYSHEEVVGTNYVDTFVPPEDHDILGEIFTKLSHSNRPTVNQNHILTKEGKHLLVEWHGRPIFKSEGTFEFFFGVGIDISERSHAEEALRESEERFRQMAELLPVTLYEADLFGNIKYANQAAFNASGYTNKDVEKGLNIVDIVVPEERTRVKQSIPRILSGKYIGGTEYTGLRKDGSTFPFSNYSSVIIKKNKPVGIRGLVVDLTERKEAEEKEKLYQLQLMQADKMATLGTLVAGVAHEINNPNNAIMFNLPLLQDVFKDLFPLLGNCYGNDDSVKIGGIPYDKVGESVIHIFEAMEGGSERIKHIVEDLKNFARPDPYDLNQSVHVNEMLKSSIALLNSLIKKSTRYFSVNYGRNIPRIPGNFQRLEQVVINLIQNACQSLESRDRGITITTSHIRKKNRNDVVIIVEDRGRGIDENEIKFITDPFFTTKRELGGTGLGLSISQRIIEDHHGTLDIKSRLGKGSVFTVILPVLSPSNPHSQEVDND